MKATATRCALGFLLTLTLAAGVASAQTELPSHLGVQPDAFVTLEYQNGFVHYDACTPHCASPRRIMPDGSRVSFAIPAGFVLIITDVQWRADGSSAGDSAQIWSGPIGYMSIARFDDNKVATHNEHLTSGIVVSAVPWFAFAHHLDSHLTFLFVRGYLATLARPVVK